MPTILIVEDDPQVSQLMRCTLEPTGFLVECVSDGVEALDRLQQGKIDLILLDIWLPRMDGLKVLARVRSRSPQVKVVVVTADGTPETLLCAVREHACEYIVKPFDPRKLVDVVKHLLAAPPDAAEIEVLSARPEWVELLVPCQLEAADRVQGFLMQLKADLPADVRESVGQAFHELLLNAIEWGGRLDPARKVRIAYVRGRRMLLYRIADPGPGFCFKGLAHAAVKNPPNAPIAHKQLREEKGLRPGGFGILMVRTMVDELVYNEVHNEVLFLKYLD
jgi:CheY-like chemotaxis protein/anti-sigma regulatory factor (Ser/Thr protein kinase)